MIIHSPGFFESKDSPSREKDYDKQTDENLLIDEEDLSDPTIFSEEI